MTTLKKEIVMKLCSNPEHNNCELLFFCRAPECNKRYICTRCFCDDKQHVQKHGMELTNIKFIMEDGLKDNLKHIRTGVEELTRIVDNIKNCRYIIEAKIEEEEVRIDRMFDRYEHIYVDATRSYISMLRDRFKDKIRNENKRPLKIIDNQVDEKSIKIKLLQELEKIIEAKTDSEPLFETINEAKNTISEFVEIGDRVDRTLNRSRHFSEDIWKSTLERKFSEENIVKFLTTYTDNFSYIYERVMQRSVFDWLTQIDSLFKELENFSFQFSKEVLDTSLIGCERKRINVVEASNLKDFHSQVNLIMGKFIQIDQIKLKLTQSLSMNPTSTKYMQVLLKTIPLTVHTKSLHLDLSDNHLDENRAVDIGFMLKHFHSISSLKLNLDRNIFGRSAVEMLSLSISYLKHLRSLELDFNNLNNEAMEVLLLNLQRKDKLTRLTILAQNNCLTSGVFSTITRFIRSAKKLRYLKLHINNDIFDRPTLEDEINKFGEEVAAAARTKKRLKIAMVYINRQSIFISSKP